MGRRKKNLRSIRISSNRGELFTMASNSLLPRRVDPDVYGALLADSYYGEHWDDFCDYDDYVNVCRCMGVFDDMCDYDDETLLYPPGVIKPHKDCGLNKKLIWFYPDYHSEDDRMEFDDMVQFSEFCKDEGYQIPLEMYTAYAKSECKSMHCCLDPFMRSVGRHYIAYSDSYGGMFYEVCDSEELP